MPNRATLLRSLIALQSERRTGVLTINHAVGSASTRLVLCLRDGAVVFATETTPGRSLGRRLVQHGFISEALFARVVSQMPKTFGFDEPVRFCETTVALGILTDRSILKVLDDEAKQTVIRAFSPANVEWTFEDATLDYLVAMIELVRRPQPVNVEAALLEAMRKAPLVQKLEAIEKTIDAMPIVVMGATNDIVRRFELSPIEAKVLEALALANEPPRAILERTKDPALDPFALLAALTITRVVRDAIAPASSRRMPAVQPVSMPPEDNVRFGPATPASPLRPSSSRAPVAVIVREEPAATPAAPSRSPAPVVVATGANPLEKKTLREAFEPVSIAPPTSDRISLLVPDTLAAKDGSQPPASGRTTSSSSSRTSPNPPPASGPAVSSRPTLKSGSGGASQSPSPSPVPTSSVARTSVTPRVPSPAPPSGPKLAGRPTTDPLFPRTRPSDVQLAGGRKTPPPSSPEGQLMAERLLSAAVEHVKVGRWQQAHADLVRVAEMLPESEKVQLYLRWTTIQLRPNAVPTKHEKVDLARAAASTLKQDADFAFAYYVVADLSLNDGDVMQAHRLLTKAVKLDPTLLDAARLLRVVERRTKEAPSKGGILGKKLL